MLIRREYEDAGEVISIPGHFLFREISQDMIVLVVRVIGIGKREEVEEEGRDIEEDGFMIEEKFREEGEVLRKEFMFLPVYLPDRVPAMLVYFGAWRRGPVVAKTRMLHVGINVT